MKSAVRSWVVYLVVFCVVWYGVFPVFAATPAARQKAGVRVVSSLDWGGRRGTLSPKEVVAKLRSIREKAVVDEHSSNPKTVRKSARALQWLAILEANTDLERHESIRQLPVTVISSAPTDGSAGTVKTFMAGGKARLTVFFPDAPPAGAEPLPSLSGRGPFVPAESPVAEDVCDDGEPAPCATEQDLEDFAIAIADASAEHDYQSSEYDAYAAQLGQYGEACDGLATSGPSLSDVRRVNCFEEAAVAVGSLGSLLVSISENTWLYRVTVGMVSVGRNVLFMRVTGLVGLSFAAGYFVGSFGVCVYDAMTAPVAVAVREQPGEDVLWSRWTTRRIYGLTLI